MIDALQLEQKNGSRNAVRRKPATMEYLFGGKSPIWGWEEMDDPRRTKRSGTDLHSPLFRPQFEFF